MDANWRKEQQDKALLKALHTQEEKNPHIVINVAADELLSQLTEQLKETGGRVHVESLFCALGALGGFAAHLAAIKATENSEQDMMVATDNEGRRYFFGDTLNAFVAEGATSIWGLCLATTAPINQAMLPDLNELLKHVVHTIGTPEFGQPRFSPPAAHLPEYYVRTYAPVLGACQKRYQLERQQLPFLIGAAIQKLLNNSTEILSTEKAIKIVMESAIPMSKLDWYPKRK